MVEAIEQGSAAARLRLTYQTEHDGGALAVGIEMGTDELTRNRHVVVNDEGHLTLGCPDTQITCGTGAGILLT